MKPENKNDSTLPIYETFYAFQGEGTHLGRAAFFIRTFGCPVQCSWCDSLGTWHKDYIPSKIEHLTVKQLTQAAKLSRAAFVVITGGEPAIHDLTSLTSALHAAGLKTHIETCGAFPLKGNFDWITVSPKWDRLPLKENLQRANEIKLIVQVEADIERWWNEIKECCLPNSTRNTIPDIWLQPEAHRLSPELLNIITRAVKAHPDRYRAGIQLHKIYNCDTIE